MNREIKALTGIRGIAALYVAVYHIRPPSGAHDPLSIFGQHGYLAVDLFFVLSGFVMAMTYGAMFKDGFSLSSFLDFLKRRIARVYPLYLAITLLMAALVIARHTQNLYGDFWTTFVANIFMVQAWGFGLSIASAAWSISTEWAAYLVFPALAALMLNSRAAIAGAFGAACLLMIAVVAMGDGPLILGSQPSRNGPLDLTFFDSVAPMVRCIAGFSLGLLTYRAHKNQSAARLFSNATVANVIAVLVLGMLFVPDSDVVAVALFPALILTLSFEAGAFSRVLRSKGAYLLGLWSYSIYLIHPKFFILASAIEARLGAVPAAGLFATVATLAVVITLGWLSYGLIELPGRKLVNLIFSASSRTPWRRRDYEQG